MAQKLVDKFIKSIKAPSKGSKLYFDTEVAGFALRVSAPTDATPNGRRTFVLNYRFDGRERRYTIGRYGPLAWSLEAARTEAKKLRLQIDLGQDPQQARTDRRTAPTISDLCERYFKEYLPSKKASDGRVLRDRQMIDADILPALGKMKVADIHEGDIEKLRDAITGRGSPIRANRVLALLSKMFSIAMRRQSGDKEPWVTRNPVRGVDRNPEERRERFLSPAEIAKVSDALASYADRPDADCLTFCLLTGCRSGEAMAAKWGNFSDGLDVWTKPASTTKTAKVHRVPLSAPARELLQRIQNESDGKCDFVFVGKDGKGPIKALGACWKYVRQETGLYDVRIHDLRHAFASVAVSGGASLPLIGALLGHTSPATTARYAHLADDALRAVTERVGEAVMAASNGKEAEIVPLKGARR